MTPRVLVACEYSGFVREAFARRGWEAWSCDLLESEKPSLFHHQGDVLELLEEPWDLLIGHPPCTYLTNSQNKHLYLGKTKADKIALGYQRDVPGVAQAMADQWGPYVEERLSQGLAVAA